jgi:hypothetical protein
MVVSAFLLFFLCLYYLASFILPLERQQPVFKALRCLVTFVAGINAPFYVLEDREKVERVPGSQFFGYLGGPGIFLTGPDHAVAVSNQLKFSGVRGPGVVFTERFELIQEPMDLRPQQRTYPVEAVTKDGMRVKVTAFGPFQLDVGERKPRMGAPFPLCADSIFKAFHARPIEIKRNKLRDHVLEERELRRWDELYEIVGARVVQDIIADYEFNALYEPLRLDRDPRREIAKAYRERMGEELAEYGIRVLGGGISNLMPADKEAVIERRVLNWQAEWQRKTLEQLGAAEAEAERIIGQTRAQVQVEMIQHIGRAIVDASTEDREVIMHVVALRFVESLNRMVGKPEMNDRLPPAVVGIVRGLQQSASES